MIRKLDQKTKKKIINYLQSRFGINKNFFDNYVFTIKGTSISIINSDKEKDINKIINTNFIKNIGLEIFSNYKEYRPSSLGFSIFNSKQICQNFVELNRKQANDYFQNKEIKVDDIQKKNLLSSGFVVCIFDKYIIGTAEYIKSENIIKSNLSFINKKIK